MFSRIVFRRIICRNIFHRVLRAILDHVHERMASSVHVSPTERCELRSQSRRVPGVGPYSLVLGFRVPYNPL